MSQRAVEELGAEYELNPVGTGPYKVVEVRPGEGVSMERWDEYNWGPEFFEGANTGPYNFDRIEFSILPEEATRIAALESGDIDYVNGISNPLDVAILEAAGVTVQQAPFGQVRMVYLQNHVPPFDDARVRQALNYAVNREEITQIVTDGADQISRGPISPGMLGYDPEIEEQCGYHFDLDRAKELMQEAGYTYGDDGMLITPDGEPFSLTLIGEPVDSGTAYMEVLQSMWRELGLDITLESTEPSILYPRLTERDYQMGYGRRGGWTSYDYLYAIYHSSTGRDLPGSMRSAVDDPTTDALLEKNRAMASDNPELQGSINELYCHIAEQSYSVWISDGVFRPSIGPRVQGTVAGPAFAGAPCSGPTLTSRPRIADLSRGSVGPTLRLLLSVRRESPPRLFTTVLPWPICLKCAISSPASIPKTAPYTLSMASPTPSMKGSLWASSAKAAQAKPSAFSR